MERSQSCTNFSLYSSNSCASPVPSLPSHFKMQTSVSSSNLLKVIKHKHLQRLQRAVSSDNNSSRTRFTGTAVTSTSTSTNPRRKRFQRQKSAVYSNDELEYAADLDEDGDDDDDNCLLRDSKEDDNVGCKDRLEPTLPTASNLMSLKKKQVRFRHKQQSDSSLLVGLKKATINSKVMKCFEKCDSEASLNSSYTTSTTVSGHERRLKSDGSYDSVGSEQFSLRSRLSHRDSSIVHSDSSQYSSVDSLLESRKPDPEAILINLGFGPVGSEDILSRIPKRFLKPSQVHGIDTEAFIKRLQLASSIADHSVLGYRGLTGNPDQPPSHIVAKIMQRFEVNERKKSLSSSELKLR